MIADHRRRQELGEAMSDDALIEANPQLMPELGEELRKLQLIAAARKRAAQLSIEGGPIVVSCPNPNCRTRYKINEGRLGGRAQCKKCGLKFDLNDWDVGVDPSQPAATVTYLPVTAPAGETEHVDPHLEQRKALHSPKASQSPLALRAGFPSVSPYLLERKLGSGSMGDVYLARDPRLDRQVAIKLMSPGLAMDSDRNARFLREARMAAKVQHPNTVVIHEVDVRDGQAFLVMEFVDGHSLDKGLVGKTPMDWHAATLAIRDAAAGLDAAHELGVIHRDVKPANLMRTRGGVTKVVDFGLARAVQCDTQLTQEGFMLGTPAYMAPELWDGRQADERSDIYALACSYYHLLTGLAPFAADSLPALGYQHRFSPFPDPREKSPQLPEAVCAIVARGTHKDPDERYQRAAQMLSDVEAILASSPTSTPKDYAEVDVDSNAEFTEAMSETQHIVLSTRAESGRASRTSASSDWFRRARTLAIAVVVVLFVASVAILSATSNYGTVSIEFTGHRATVGVKIDGENIDAGELRSPLRIKAGSHVLTVTSGDFETITRSFQVGRGTQEVVRVALPPETTTPPVQLPRTEENRIAELQTNAQTQSSRSETIARSQQLAEPEIESTATAAAEGAERIDQVVDAGQTQSSADVPQLQPPGDSTKIASDASPPSNIDEDNLRRAVEILECGGRCWAKIGGVDRELRDPSELPQTLSNIWKVSFDTDNGHRVTDADLNKLSVLTGLEELYLGGTQITGEGLVHVAPCRRLRKLELAGTKLNDRGLVEIGKLASLRELNCNDTPTTDGGLFHLKTLALEALQLDRTQLTDIGLAELAGMPLKLLSLSETQITDGGMSHVGQIHTLVNLTSSHNRINDDGVKELGTLIELRSIDLSYTQASDLSIRHLPKEIEILKISYTRVTGKGLRSIGRFSNLKRLESVGNKIDAGLSFLRRCQQLETVDVAESDFTDHGLAGLARCSQLRELIAYRTAVRGNGLRKLRNLEGLNLDQTNVDKSSVDEIAALSQLKWLFLGGDKLVDSDLANIDQLAHLEYLNLANNDLTDAILPKLAGLVRLNALDLTNNSKISVASIDVLRGQLKQTYVIFSPSPPAVK